MRLLISSVVLVLGTTAGWAKHGELSHFDQQPWFTGPLVCPASHVTPAGKYDIQPYYYLYSYDSSYDKNWKKVKDNSIRVNMVQVEGFVGLTRWMDLNSTSTFVYNVSHGHHAFHFNSFEVGVDFQILTDRADNYLPALILSIQVVFPIGKFDHLDPNKFQTDTGSDGKYITGLAIVTSRLFHLRDAHWLNVRFAWQYAIPSRVHIHGNSFYGGGQGTNGYVYPPQTSVFDLAFELSLTRNWVLACDAIGRYSQSRKFKGNPGLTPQGTSASLVKGSVAEYTLAPAIEYNWSENLGVLTGAWFTVAGRNVNAFTSWIGSVNYFF